MARPRKDRAFGPTLREVRQRLGLGVGAFTRLMGWSPTRKRDVQRIERGKDSASASFRERSADVLLPLAKRYGYEFSRKLFIKGVKACIFKLAVDGAAEGIKSLREADGPAARNEAPACGDYAVLTAKAGAAESVHEWAVSLSWFEQAEQAAWSPRETLEAQIGQIRSLFNLHMLAAEPRLHNVLSRTGLPDRVDMLGLGDLRRLIRDEGVLRLLPELLDYAARVYHAREDFTAEDRVRQVVIRLAEQHGDKQTVLRARRRRGGMHTHRLRYARADAEAASALQMALPELRAAFEGLRDPEDRAHAARRLADALVLGGGVDREIVYYLDAAKEAHGPKSRAVVNVLLVQAEHHQRQGSGRYAGVLDQATHLGVSLKSAGILASTHYQRAQALVQWHGHSADRTAILRELALALSLDSRAPTARRAKEAMAEFACRVERVEEVNFREWFGNEAELVRRVEGVPAYDPERIRRTEEAVRNLLPTRLRIGTRF